MHRLFAAGLSLISALWGDSVWTYSTYIGGQGADTVLSVASDAAGNTFAAGSTFSIGPPFSDVSPGFRSAPYAFAVKLDANGALVFARIFGEGSVTASAVDADGNLYVAGQISAAIPLVSSPNAFQGAAPGGGGFVAKIGPAGETLFATYFGSRGTVSVNSMAVDSERNPVFCGRGMEQDIPLTDPTLFAATGRKPAAYCAKLNGDGSQLLFSTLLGVSGPLSISAGLTPEGKLLVAGSATGSVPLVNARQGEARRRLLFRQNADGTWVSLGGPELGTVLSVQSFGDRVFLATANGVWASSDRGLTWLSFAVGGAQRVSAHPLNPRFICAATQSQQAVCTTDGGENWAVRVFSGVAQIVPDPQVEGGFFAPSQLQSSLNHYINLGTGVSPKLNFPASPISLSLDESGDRILIVSGPSRALFRSVDRGASFTRISENVGLAAQASSNPEVIYAARYIRVNEVQSRVLRSGDGGQTWADIPLGHSLSRVDQIVVDPRNPDTVYAIGGGAVRSDDGGQTEDFVQDPGLPNRLILTLALDSDRLPLAGALDVGSGFLMTLNLAKPALEYATLFDGGGGFFISGLKVDEIGRPYIIGNSGSLDLPVTGPDLWRSASTNTVGFLARFSLSGEVETARYIGPPSSVFDRDRQGRLHLGLSTKTSQLPDAIPVVQGEFKGMTDVLWLVLDADATIIQKATWLGGAGVDSVFAIQAGADANIRLAGSTDSEDFPASTQALQLGLGGRSDGFLSIAPNP